MSQRTVGILLQIGAVLALLSSLAGPFSVVVALLSSSPRSSKLNLDFGECLLPFALWFLGSELKRKSEDARRVTKAAMAYLAIMGVFCLVFLLTTRVLDHMRDWMKVVVYAAVVLVIVVPVWCIRGLRRGD